MSPDAEVTRLSATDLSVEVPGRALQRILCGVNLAGGRIYGAELRAV